MSTILTDTEIEYPESDGKPMGETDLHRYWMIRIYDILRWRYRQQRVYVGSDLLVYYTEGIPQHFVVPDDFVVLNSDPGPRRVFKVWEEGAAPNVVFEVTSRKTRQRDSHGKPGVYATIGVQELFLFDPTADYLQPPLQAYRFENSQPVRQEADENGMLRSDCLGLRLRLEHGRLDMFDAQTGERQLTEAEWQRAAAETFRAAADAERAAAEAIRAAAEAEHAARIAAEEEARRLRAEIERLRGGAD
jgi:Uma2 family endonuclease